MPLTHGTVVGSPSAWARVYCSSLPSKNLSSSDLCLDLGVGVDLGSLSCSFPGSRARTGARVDLGSLSSPFPGSGSKWKRYTMEKPLFVPPSPPTRKETRVPSLTDSQHCHHGTKSSNQYIRKRQPIHSDEVPGNPTVRMQVHRRNRS